MDGIEKLKSYIKEEKDALPKALQEIVESYQWLKEAEDIGMSHNLPDKKILYLQTETALVLLGLATIYSLPKNIEYNVEISEQEAENITKELDQKVFNPTYQNLSKEVKEHIKDKKPTWKQNVGFVMSDGNYATFLDPREKYKKAHNAPKIDTSFIIKKSDIQ